MTTYRDVIRIHKAHPDWCSADIARELNCFAGYVRETAKRRSLNLPKARSGPNGKPHTKDMKSRVKLVSA